MAFEESLAPPAEKKPDKKPEKRDDGGKPRERTLLAPREVMKQFGLQSPAWSLTDDVVTAGPNSGATTLKPRKVSSFEFGFKIKARRAQTLHVLIDGRRYSYSRGSGFGGWATLVDAAGQQDSRWREQVASENDWCSMSAALRDNTLKFYYQGREEWSGAIGSGRSTKHTVQVGFGTSSTRSGVEIKDLYFDAE